MQSCDTFALCSGIYFGKKNLLAKNSDRPLGECQTLRYFPAEDHAPGETLKCTYLTIDQAEHTYAMLGSQPYWIWGFEMGINEWGLSIGNEAEWSRCETETADGLLGMDLLRLALERSRTARQAIDVISELLAKYGQWANASPLYDRRYENSYLLVDPKEVWVMETAGRHWVAKRIHDWKAISNCYSVGEDFDLCSEGIREYARDRRWLAPAQPFDFTKAFSKPDLSQRAAVPRWRRLCKLIGAAPKPMDDGQVKAVLRDHFEGEIMEPRFGATYGLFMSICMHAMVWDGSQTAASVLFSYDETLGVTARYAPSMPCCSIYIPVYMTGSLPKAMERGGEYFDEASLWWQTERLEMAVSIDEERFGKDVRAALRMLEEKLSRKAEETEATAVELVRKGDCEKAMQLLNALTEQAVGDMLALVTYLHSLIAEAVKADGGLYGQRKEFLESYCGRVKMPLLG